MVAIGFLGSGHCLVMCGGMAGALQLSFGSRPRRQQWLLQACLSLGRLLSYSLLGALVAGFGAVLLATLGIALFWLKLLAGLLLLAMALYIGRLWFGLLWLEKSGTLIWRRVQPLAKALMPLDSPHKALGYGLCWGLLPCGLVYSALGWSLATASPIQGALSMFAFGLGTIPAIWLSGTAAARLNQLKGQHWVRAGAAAALALYAFYLIWLALAPRFF